MTEMQRQKVRKMRLDGIGYRHIATELGVSLYTVKSYCRRHMLTGSGMVVALNNDVMIDRRIVCKFCGRKLNHTKGKKRKTYCSDNCRKKHWKTKHEVKQK